MRTTITIDDKVFVELQRRAAVTGLPINRLIEDAVKRMIRWGSEVCPRESFRLVTFGRGGRFSSLDVNKTSALLEVDDVERFQTSER